MDYGRINTKWFEMEEIIKRDFNKKVWIPLEASVTIKQGDYGQVDFIEEYYGITTLICSENDSKKALNIDWTSISGGHFQQRPFIEDDAYQEVGSYIDFDDDITGRFPILEQNLVDNDREWFLNQDIFLALQLVKKGDSWLRPEDDYIEVVRAKRNTEGKINLIEIKTEYLKDYLCARKSGLAIYSFQSRRAIFKDKLKDSWKEEYPNLEINNGRWQGSIQEIHEGGNPLGSKTAVFHMFRTDVDFQEDVPLISGEPNDENLESKSWEVESKGQTLISYNGDLWKNEWVTPGVVSPIVREDKIKSKVHFTIDSNGNSINADDLKQHDGWLWFKPTLVNELLSKQLPVLNWYTENTGKIGGASNNAIHFGMNNLGYLNVFAEDVYFLSEGHKKIWAAYNITPDGGVSEELLMSQVNARPARTIAPEKALFEVMGFLDSIFIEKLGYKLFRDNPITENINIKINRFVSVNKQGVFKLAKEISKFVMERIDIDTLKKLMPLEKKELGSIKRLANLLNSLELNGKLITAVLVGTYELRIADAHIESSDLSDSLNLARITLDMPFPLIGKELIDNVVLSLFTIAEQIRLKDDDYIKNKIPDSNPSSLN